MRSLILWVPLAISTGASAEAESTNLKWHPLGINSAGSNVSMELSSIITGTDAQKNVARAFLKFDRNYNGRPVSFIAQTEFRCVKRQYQLRSWAVEAEGVFEEAKVFGNNAAWKSWDPSSVIETASRFVCPKATRP